MNQVDQYDKAMSSVDGEEAKTILQPSHSQKTKE